MVKFRNIPLTISVKTINKYGIKFGAFDSDGESIRLFSERPTLSDNQHIWTNYELTTYPVEQLSDNTMQEHRLTWNCSKNESLTFD